MVGSFDALGDGALIFFNDIFGLPQVGEQGGNRLLRRVFQWNWPFQGPIL